LGMGTAAFYVLWDNSAALISSTDDIASALRAGEQWREDVRNATGIITVKSTSEGETVRMPEGGGKEIVYHFSAGKVRRQLSSGASRLLLAKVKTSQMKLDARKRVTAWRWELKLKERRPEMHLPLWFTFEAAQPTP
ncbi:MAG TPA: hypothetical protein VKA67_03425, partial [Verrucomicrobiae bacterium]|nr:hypothetical protein [Verrucomicrobiae bacterium]